MHALALEIPKSTELILRRMGKVEAVVRCLVNMSHLCFSIEGIIFCASSVISSCGLSLFAL